VEEAEEVVVVVVVVVVEANVSAYTFSGAGGV